jgi:hypothetical protein
MFYQLANSLAIAPRPRARSALRHPKQEFSKYLGPAEPDRKAALGGASTPPTTRMARLRRLRSEPSAGRRSDNAFRGHSPVSVASRV